MSAEELGYIIVLIGGLSASIGAAFHIKAMMPELKECVRIVRNRLRRNQ